MKKRKDIQADIFGHVYSRYDRGGQSAWICMKCNQIKANTKFLARQHGWTCDDVVASLVMEN